MAGEEDKLEIRPDRGVDVREMHLLFRLHWAALSEARSRRWSEIGHCSVFHAKREYRDS
jgi:hypothetical protein